MELLGIIVALLFGWQESLYHCPIEYGPDWRSQVPAQVVTLHARTSQGDQVGFYWPARTNSDRTPAHLWVIFSSNMCVALAWRGFIERYPDEETAFLLIDYPGSGASQGRGSARSIFEASEAMLDATQAHIGSDFESVDVGYMGHSMGVAEELLLASVRPPDHLFLLAGFTTLPEAVGHLFGPPMGLLVLERYDNVARLEELRAMAPRPSVVIMHGDQDNFVPVSMGRRLAAIDPDWIQYRELPGADHFRFLYYQENQLYAAMLGR